MAAELIVRLRPNYNRKGLPAISLSLDTSTITACGNDFSYDELFSRTLESIGKPGDCLLGITTSGNSQNVINAMKLAKKMKIKNFGFLGAGGGEASQLWTKNFSSSNVTGRIQECHITAGHALLEYVEDSLINRIFKFKIMNINELDALILDFDGVLTDNKVYIDENGKELVCCSRADGLAFDALRKLQIPVYILSTESNPVVSARAHKLKVPVIQGVKSKIDSLNSLCTEHNYNASKILFVGNDLNDYQVIEHCGFSACPADSHDSIKKISTFVCSTNGGEGIVREVLEVVFNLNLLKILY